MIKFIFLIYSLASCRGNVSNSNVTMKFAQLHYFYHKMLGETKDIMYPLSKSWGDMYPRPPHKLGPWLLHINFTRARLRRLKKTYHERRNVHTFVSGAAPHNQQIQSTYSIMFLCMRRNLYMLYYLGSTYTKIGTIQRRLAWPLAQGWHAQSWSVPYFTCLSILSIKIDFFIRRCFT